MKKILYSLTAAALMCSLSACNALDSLLEEVNYGNPTIEDMVSNEANVVMQVFLIVMEYLMIILIV